MPFIPHTEQDIKEMVEAIGVPNIQSLFDEIPSSLLIKKPLEVPLGVNEMELKRLMKERSKKDEVALNFIGAGAYEHHIPEAVWDIAYRGEWMTCYTPYQAEASQGTLQLLYEYQTMMAELMQMEVSNASLYDGASGLAEAILMAIRCQSRDKGKGIDKDRNKESNKNKEKNFCILLPNNIHPLYQQVVQTILQPLDIDIIQVPFDQKTGLISLPFLQTIKQPIAALVIPQPNFFGCLEDVDTLTNWAHSIDAKVVALVNPIAMSLLKPPGMWGNLGADIACGEGQPLGVPLASGGPYFGFLTCKKSYIRQLPGRLVGRTTDSQHRTGYALTLQAREQHIRRHKATSNICTNQGLLVTAACIYMSLLGYEGLKAVAIKSHQNTKTLMQRLQHIKGVKRIFSDTPFFHECIIQFPIEVKELLEEIGKMGIQAGFHLHQYYQDLPNCLLICVTETKTEDDINFFAEAIEKVISR